MKYKEIFIKKECLEMQSQNRTFFLAVDRAAAGPAGRVGPEWEAAHQGGRQQAQGHQRPPDP